MSSRRLDILKDEIPFHGISPQEQLDRSFGRLKAYLRNEIGRYHPFYRKQFRDLGIRVEDIETYEDFRKIPLTRKETIVVNQQDFNLSPRYPGEITDRDAEEIDSASMAR